MLKLNINAIPFRVMKFGEAAEKLIVIIVITTYLRCCVVVVDNY